MNIKQLITRSFNKTNYCRINSFDDNNEYISAKFFMSIPASFKNSDWIKNKDTSVSYSASSLKGGSHFDRKKVNFRPGCVNINKYNYPGDVSNSKRAVYVKKYKIADLLTIDLHAKFFEDREKIFTELKSAILLEKIGVLSKQWENVSSGKGMDNYNKTSLDPFPVHESIDCSCIDCMLEEEAVRDPFGANLNKVIIKPGSIGSKLKNIYEK